MAVEMKKLSAIEEIEAGMSQAAERAAKAAENAGKPRRFVSNTIVLLKHGQTATVRPLYNMDQAIVRWMHDKFKNTDPALSSDFNGKAAPIANICAEKLSGQPCLFCVDAAANKLEANREAFVPVYVYKIVDAAGQPVLYKAQDGTFKPVQGFRLLRLKMSSPILLQLMTIWKDPDYNKDVTGSNFTITRTDTPSKNPNQPPKVTYGCTPKPPTPMNPNLKAAIPPIDSFRAALIEIFPEKVVQHAPVAQPASSLDAIADSYKVAGSVDVPEDGSDAEGFDPNF